MLLEEESPAYGGWICADGLIGFACDNRASAATPRLGTLPPFPKSGKGKWASVFHGGREQQLGSGGFSPFVESVCSASSDRARVSGLKRMVSTF